MAHLFAGLFGGKTDSASIQISNYSHLANAVLSHYVLHGQFAAISLRFIRTTKSKQHCHYDSWYPFAGEY
jgi:hypothetical protein